MIEHRVYSTLVGLRPGDKAWRAYLYEPIEETAGQAVA